MDSLQAYMLASGAKADGGTDGIISAGGRYTTNNKYNQRYCSEMSARHRPPCRQNQPCFLRQPRRSAPPSSPHVALLELVIMMEWLGRGGSGYRAWRTCPPADPRSVSLKSRHWKKHLRRDTDHPRGRSAHGRCFFSLIEPQSY